ncbi:MAG: DedA family protein [Ignavibacteria bacterium]|nr:DedA family protein [Ignavibacteria bacterium]
MLEFIVATVSGWPVWGLLLATFVVVYIENLIPPWPGDVFLVFVGALIGMQVLPLTEALGAATVGSFAGFASAYGLGRRYGETIAQSPLVPFITPPLIVKVERWFDKYHGLIIVCNRFLAGTRAVISFTAGIVKLPFPRTMVYATISSLAWNYILLSIGMQLGERWRDVDTYIATYGWIVTGLMAIVVIAFYWRRTKRKRQTRKSAAS